MARADSVDRQYDTALRIVSALFPAVTDTDLPGAVSGGTDIEAGCLYSGAPGRMNVTLRGMINGVHTDPFGY